MACSSSSASQRVTFITCIMPYLSKKNINGVLRSAVRLPSVYFASSPLNDWMDTTSNLCRESKHRTHEPHTMCCHTCGTLATTPRGVVYRPREASRPQHECFSIFVFRKKSAGRGGGGCFFSLCSIIILTRRVLCGVDYGELNDVFVYVLGTRRPETMSLRMTAGCASLATTALG